MYTTSTVYKTAIKESSRSFECRVTILDKIYKNEDIVDIIIDGNIQPTDGFMIGASTSKALDLTLLNKGDIVYGSSTIKVEIGLKIGSKIEYIPMGIYNIDDIEKTDYTVKITAFDNMIKFEKNFTTNLGDALTLQQIVNELVRITGVQFTGTVPAYTVKKLEGFSCREVLGYVASICGGNAVITRDGKFTIVTPKDINYSIGTANYFDYKREETKYKIGKISCQVDEKVLSKGSLGANSMELEFENPWVTDSILQDIYNKLNGFEYLGYFMKWQGDLSLDVGDIVTITDKKGVVRKQPILSQKFTYTGGLTSEIGAKGESKNKNSFSSSGSAANKIDRVVTELAIVNKALVDVAYIGDLTAGNIKFDTASGTIMDLQTLLAKHVTGENGQFLNLTTNNVTISNALLKDVIAANISVQDLKAGNIDTNRFNIVGPNGNLVIKDNTIQIKDTAKVRVQIGKDASGDYSMYVWDKQGRLMFDALGLKSDAIKDKIIRDDMVSDNANINGSKLNISSLITEINKDNTQTLKATKIELDKTGQSLEVSFNSLKANVDNMEIGGRNLMRYSAPELLKDGDENVYSKWTSGRGSLKSDYLSGNDLFNGKKVYWLTLTPGENNCWTSLRYADDKFFKVEKDEDYYLNIKAYVGQNCKGISATLFIEGDQLNQTIYKYSKTSATGIGLDEKITFKANFTGKAYLCIYNNGAIDFNNGDSNLLFREIMFGKGNKAPDWSPAPEDISDKIQSNTTSISAIQGKISSLITDTTIEKNGEEIKLKDAYSALSQTVNDVTTTVTKTESKFNNLQIGGRNLLSGTKDFSGAGITGDVLSEYYNYKGFPALYAENWGDSYIDVVYWNNSIDVKPSSEYTLSFYAKGGGQIASYFYPSNVENGYSSEGIETYSNDGCIVHTLTGEWKKYSITWKTLPNAWGFKNVLPMRLLAGAYGYICGIKFEEGNKDTDWSPSNEEIDKSISGLSTRVKSAEEKITPSAIVKTVKEHQTNGVNTFALSSDVKQTTDSIISTVSSNTSSINGLQSSVSSITQTTDAWIANFSSKGGYNLIRNGNVTRHRLNYWWTEYGANIWPHNDEWIGIYKHGNIEGFLVSETFRVEPGKTYSFSCQVSAEGNTLGADVYFIGSSNNDRHYGWTPCLGTAVNGETKTIEYTFTVPNHINYGYIRLDANGSTNYNAGFVCWFKDMVLIEGSVPAKTFIPNKSEIYEGSTMIDASGVTIYNGALKVENSNGVATIDGSKLMFRLKTWGNGSIVIPNGSQTAVVTIPHNLGFAPVFKGQVGYISNNYETEYYSDAFSLYSTDNGTVLYNVRMFVTNTYLKVIAWRAKHLANSGTKTFYYRYFIEEGVNL